MPEDDASKPAKSCMTCLDCGYALDGLRSTACPECGLEFDPHDATTFQRVLYNAAKLARLPVAEATAACAYLEEHGVPAKTVSERGGVIGYAEISQASLWVDRDDVETARELLRTLVHAKTEREDWICAGCGEHVEAQFDLCWNCGAERA